LFRWGNLYALWWQGDEGIKRIKERLTDFSYLQDRLQSLAQPLITSLVKEYDELLVSLTEDEGAQFLLWPSFFRERAHILKRGNKEWPAYKILLQLAVEHGDDSPVTLAAEKWLAEGHCNWIWLRDCHRPTQVTIAPTIRVFEGHKRSIQGVRLLKDGR